MAARFGKCIVHIGTEKTGTTTIQAFLHLNRMLLNQRGFTVPASLSPYARMANHERLTTFSLGTEKLGDDRRQAAKLRTIDDVLLHRKQVREDLIAELDGAGELAPTLLLSNEHCHSRLVTVEEVRTLRDFLGEFAGSFEVLVYLRPQHELAISLYDQALKGGFQDISILPDFHAAGTRWVSQQYFDYSSLLARWGAVFGQANLRPRIYDRRQLAGGSIVTDLLSAIGCSAEDVVLPPDRNTSIPTRLQPALNAVNRYAKAHPGCAPPIVRGRLIEQLQKTTGEAAPPVSRAEAIAFFNQFAATNEQVRQQFFAERGSLFEPDFAVFPNERPAPCSETDALAEMLLRTIAASTPTAGMPVNPPAKPAPPAPAGKMRPGAGPVAIKLASFSAVAQSSELIFGFTDVALPKVCVYSNVSEYNAKFARHLEEDIYAARKVRFDSVRLLDLPPDTIVHGNLNFVTTSGDTYLAEQFHKSWHDPRAPQRHALASAAPIVKVADASLLVARFGESTWGHWLGELLPRVVAAEATAPGKYRFVVPFDTTRPDSSRLLVQNVLGSLQAYGIGAERLLPIGTASRYQFARLAAVSPMWIYPHAIHPGVLTLMRQSLKIAGATGERPKAAALLRLRNTGRVLENASEVLDHLKHRGFVPVDIGGLTFAEQVGVFQAAPSLFGVLGSNLAGLLYSPVGVKAVSAAPGDWGDCFFHGLLQAQQGVYSDLRGTPVARPGEVMKPSFTLAITKLAEALDAVTRASG